MGWGAYWRLGLRLSEGVQSALVGLLDERIGKMDHQPPRSLTDEQNLF